MNKIEVKVFHQSHGSPASMMTFLAKLTQRGHNIKTYEDLRELYDVTCEEPIYNLVDLPHGTIKRFTPITIAIVGASRRFLTQVRTHQVGFNFISASLQYSDYSNEADFMVPYSVAANNMVDEYLSACKTIMNEYDMLAIVTDNDTAGYLAPHALRNIVIIQANHEAWMYFIKLRACNRNTEEMQYIALRVWDELLNNTEDGKEMFKWAGPECLWSKCKEGKMACDMPLNQIVASPKIIIDERWPRLNDIYTRRS